MSTRRVALVGITTEAFVAILGGRRYVRFTGLPPDARLIRADYDLVRDSFQALFESKEFEPVAEGEVAPVRLVGVEPAGTPGPEEAAGNVITDRLSAARVADLTLRAGAGTLTSAELLALAVLRGGGDGENAVGPLIDAAQEEFGNGTYRVPVRVVADKSRLKVVVRMPPGQRLSEFGMTRVRTDVENWMKGNSQVLVVPPGASLQVFEIGDTDESGVVVQESGVVDPKTTFDELHLEVRPLEFGLSVPEGVGS